MVEVLCGKCGHAWDYKGKAFFCQCPRCRVLQRLSEIVVKKDGDE